MYIFNYQFIIHNLTCPCELTLALPTAGHTHWIRCEEVRKIPTVINGI